MTKTSPKVLHPGQKIRILIVDDSVVIRRLITHALDADPDIEVVGVAVNGVMALSRLGQYNPDVVTLDIEMPEMDGIETLRRMRRDFPGIRAVMFSTLTERGAAITLEALALGASDYVTKVSNEGSLDQSLARLRRELIPKIKQFFVLPSTKPAPPRAPVMLPPRSSRTLSITSTRPQVVGIGISTGGPAALAELLPRFPVDFPLPILIVQHMPPVFTRLLADRLNSNCPLRVREAQQGDLVTPGHIWIAPGDYHMKVVKGREGVRILLDQSPQQNSCRPAVDALFFSMAEVYGGAVCAAVLTGMGQDGMRGAEALKASGAWVIAQDEESSVVWGMPGAVVHARLADEVLPLHQVASGITTISAHVQSGRSEVHSCPV